MPRSWSTDLTTVKSVGQGAAMKQLLIRGLRRVVEDFVVLMRHVARSE
jgi:hypothetical protein